MGQDDDIAGQLELIPAPAETLAQARARTAEATARVAAKEKRKVQPAATDPVARVLVDVPLAHLDRPFDYLVVDTMADAAVPGARVKVRFAGQDVDGFVVERRAESEHEGRLSYLRRVVSPEPVLSAEVAQLSGLVAARYAGTRSDVLRLAVPPRHATVEKEPTPTAPDTGADLAEARRWWGRYAAGTEWVDALDQGRPARAVASLLPGDDWAVGLAHAAAATLAAGRGSVLCVPDGRDLAQLDAALTQVLGAGRHVSLTAELGPAERYRRFLAVSRGAVRVVAGTRAAAFAPVRDLGLVATWDDGDDLYAEPRAPYPHTREVLLLRAHQSGAGVLLAAVARSVEASALVSSGWARDLSPSRDQVRAAAPTVAVTGATDTELARDPWARSARLPSSAHSAIRSALEAGPVLVQAPRSGYAASLVCEACRTPVRCPTCAGPVHLPRPHLPPTCRWCGESAPALPCKECGSASLRAPVVGERRTAEELGRAFPGVTVRRSTGDRVLEQVPDQPAIVVATPGAEPPAEKGYAAVVLLDTWLMLARPDLRTVEESARRWFNAAALARGRDRGGRVVAVGDPAQPALQALVRWDPAGLAEREAQDRAAAHLPPASRLAVLSGSEETVTEALAELVLPPGAEVLGPVPVELWRPQDDEPQHRAVVRVPRAGGSALSRALVELQGVRSARKRPPVKVQVDPYELG